MDKIGKIQKIDAQILLDTMLSAVDERFIVVNKEGYIEALSKAYAEFLGVEQQNVLGRHVSEVIENTRMDIVTKTGLPETGEFQEINGEKMIATRIPIFKEGEVIGPLAGCCFEMFGILKFCTTS